MLLAKTSGCGKFIKRLQKHDIIEDIKAFAKKHRSITLFCPVDGAVNDLKLFENQAKMNIKDLLRFHVAVKHDSHGTMYRSMLTNMNITLNLKHVSNKEEV